VRLAIAAALTFLVFAAPARASFTVTPADTQAGGHTDVTIHADFATTPSHVVLHLPPGLVGNPNAATKCPPAQFEGLGCSGASIVGSVTANGLLPGTVYDLAPNAGEPARLGIDIIGLVKNEASVTLRPDGGLDSTIAQLSTGLIPLPLTSLNLTLNASFMRLPTSCAPATTTIDADTVQSASFTPTGCGGVPFNPSVAAAPVSTQRAVPTGATVTLSLPADQSDVRRAQIALPVGTTLNPGVANGLAACTAAQFAGPGCPAASQIGTVSFVTPLLGTLPGSVYFGDGFKLYVVVDGGGVHVALPGDVHLDPATGQITTVFDNLPQVPFSSFALTFRGGPTAVLENPDTCGTKTVSALLTPWSGTAPKTVTGAFAVNGDCGTPALAPSLQIGATSTAAGRPAGAVTLAVSRPDGSQDFSQVTTQLPPGLAGSLKGVPTCSDADADAGTCPAASRVGSVATLVGGGSAPVPLAGTVFLTGPTDGGVAGLAIALPAQVGPVNLGTAVVRAGIVLRPDGGLNVTTRPLPRFVGGVPVSIRSLALTLDRPGFILNASSCAAQQVTAIVSGAAGGSASVSAPYQATDCAGLAFKPRLQATIGSRGHTRRNTAAPLHVVVTVPAGQAATARAEVALPQAVGLSIARLRVACQPPAYAAGQCPATSRIGSAVATTPLLADPLTSPVTLAIPSAGSLPGLDLRLTGAATVPLFGQVELPGADHRIHNVFAGIPDVPLERFDLSFTRAAPLQLTRDVCHGPRQHVLATLTAHSGAVAKLSAPLKVAGCAPVATLRHGRVRVTPGRDGARIRSVRRHGARVVVRDAAGATWRLKVRR
jgi:hypothetical protein